MIRSCSSSTNRNRASMSGRSCFCVTSSVSSPNGAAPSSTARTSWKTSNGCAHASSCSALGVSWWTGTLTASGRSLRRVRSRKPSRPWPHSTRSRWRRRSRTSSRTMRSRLLRRHFISQFVENDLSPDMDRHQLLALAAAGLVTLPLFATIFMSVKYLMQPLQSPGWTQITAMGDQLVFCATSMLVSAIIATLEWDALALSPRDAMILGVLPVPHREIVSAKVWALVTFAAAFVIALNALPTLMHPPLMVANFQGNPLLLLPLIAAHGLSTCMAGAFGFACVVGLREFLFLWLGEYRLSRVAGTLRSGLLFSFLVLLVLGPIRLYGLPSWMFEPGGGSALLQPVTWFAATHAAIAGRVIDTLPTPNLPERLSVEESRLRTQYQNNLPHLTALALRGTAVLLTVLTITLGMYLRNARRLQVMPDRPGS